MPMIKDWVVAGAIAVLATAAVCPHPGYAQTKIPATLQKAAQLNVGVKCDAPPAAFLDEQGKPAGIDIEFARHIAELAFGDPGKAAFTCVTSATRIQMLTTGKVDLVIATMAPTEERKKVVDFATSTNWDSSTVLVRAESRFNKLEDFNGKTLLTTKGGWQAPYLEKQYPQINLVKLDSVNDAIQALRQGRADGVTQDVEPLLAAADQDPALKLTDIAFLIGWGAPAVRRGDDELRLFINEMVSLAKKDGTFEAAVRKYASGKLREIMLDGYEKPAPDGSSSENSVVR